MGDKVNEDDDEMWLNLSTVSTIDTGDDTWRPERIETSLSGGRAIGRVAPSTSLLIESLVTVICSLCEDEPVLRDKLFKTICDGLFEMNLINNSYTKCELDTLRGQHQLALYRLLMVAKQATGCNEIIKLPDIGTFMSRYKNEFDETGFIASGGFGSVYKARNKLDGNEYAIKKIIVRSGRVESILKHLDEVKTLAKFNHINIVAYKGAWIEKNRPTTFVHHEYSSSQSESIDSQDKSNQDSSTNYEIGSKYINQNSNNSNNNNNNNNNTKSSINYYNKNKKTGRIIKDQSSASVDINNKKKKEKQDKDDDIDDDDDDDGISFRDDSSVLISFRNDEEAEDEEDDDDDLISFRTDSDSNGIEVIKSSDTSTSENDEQSPANQNHVAPYNSSKMNSYATLYIQMGLCEETLREWMDKRQEPSPLLFLVDILKQTLEGIHYMHSLGAVHHDIKPSNIFIDTTGSLRIQLGDFGLTCPLQQESHPAMGTQIYAAPEQLQGQCDPKSDIYSIGIIFFELLFPMSTGMERSQLISQAKDGKFSDSHYQQYPDWCELIKRLIQKDPKKRPSAKSLLHELSPDKDKDLKITALNDNNKKKDTEIEYLKNENKKLKRQNEELNDAFIKLKNELEQLKLKHKNEN